MKINCPSCGTTTDLDSAFAGRKVLCAVCDVKYIAPRWQFGPGQIVADKSTSAPSALPPIDLPPIEVPDISGPAPAPQVDGSGNSRSAPAPPVGVPGVSAPSATGRAAANLSGPDPKSYLKLAVEKGYLASAQADRLHQAYESSTGRGSATGSFGEFLVQRGLVTAEENRSLFLLLHQGSGKKSIRAAAIAMLVAKGGRECPNCFEVNVPGAKACRYCAVALTDSATARQCPNCFVAQPCAEPLCRGCGVDMGTGLLGVGARAK